MRLAGRAVALAIAAVATAGCHASPRPPLPSCKVVPFIGRNDAMFVQSPVDAFAGLPSDLIATAPRREAPLAYLRTGDNASRLAIAAARGGISHRDCRPSQRALAARDGSHPDDDYLTYLWAWCDHASGASDAAEAKLAGLVATQDDVLAQFVPAELIELVARDADTDVAPHLLAAAGLWRAPYIDDYATALFRAGKRFEAILFVEAHPDETPHGADLRCRAGVEQCRRMVEQGWPIRTATCAPTPLAASAECRRWEDRGMVAALLAWRPHGSADDAGTIRDLAHRYRNAVPALGERLDLVELVASFDVWRANPRKLVELARDADILARTTASGAIARSARALRDAIRTDLVGYDEDRECTQP